MTTTDRTMTMSLEALLIDLWGAMERLEEDGNHDGAREVRRAAEAYCQREGIRFKAYY